MRGNLLIFKRCFLVSRGKDALPFTKCFGRGLTKKDWQPHGLGGSNRQGWKCCLLKTRKGSSDLLKTTSLQLGGGPSSLGHHGPCQQPGTVADRAGECLLVLLLSAFRAWWLHPQLRPALGSRREAGALPTGSADPPARDCTRLLHVSLLVVANAHMGPRP